MKRKHTSSDAAPLEDLVLMFASENSALFSPEHETVHGIDGWLTSDECFTELRLWLRHAGAQHGWQLAAVESGAFKKAMGRLRKMNDQGECMHCICHGPRVMRRACVRR
jgi:hypothetical protein